MKNKISFILLAIFLIFLTSCTKDIFGPPKREFRIAVHNRTKSTLKVFFNGNAETPLLGPGDARQYRPEVIAERRSYGNNQFYVATIHISAKDVITGNLSDTKTVYAREYEVESVVFDRWDF